MKLSHEPNRRRQQMFNRLALGMGPAFGAVVAIGGELTMTGSGACAALVAGGISALAGLYAGGVHALSDGSTPLTCRPLPGTERDVANMMSTLVDLSQNGLRPSDRPSVQQAVDRGSAALMHIMGEHPWVAMKRGSGRWKAVAIAHGSDRHPGQMGLEIAASSDLQRLSECRFGMEMAYARALLTKCLPALASIASAFDLDARGLRPMLGPLPGMTKQQNGTLTNAASRVHQLATLWLSADTRNVDPILRLEADAAAGRDLRDLESVWETARSQALPERIEAVDATYRNATDALEKTLETALDACGDRAMDALTTHATYISTKHATNALKRDPS